MKNRPPSPKKKPKPAETRKRPPARAARRSKTPRPSRAVVRFRSGWTETLEGELRSGGILVIDYDPSRLSDCHTTWRGQAVWSITAYARFHPGGATEQGPVLEDLSEAGLVHGHRPKELQLRIPEGAERVEIWFHSSSAMPSACEAWDSRYGQNYWFEVARPEEA